MINLVKIALRRPYTTAIALFLVPISTPSCARSFRRCIHSINGLPPNRLAPRREVCLMAKTKDGSAAKLYVFSVITIVIAGASAAYFHFVRNQEISTVREARALVAERGPRIEIVSTSAGPTVRTIRLLGDVRSGSTATLYSKVAGYLKTVHVDKGDMVEFG